MTTAPPQLARCTERGCPVRFRHGPDRLCRSHRADDTSVNLTTRASGFGVTMTAFDDGGQSADNSADNGGHGDGQAADRRPVNRHGVPVR